MDLDQMKVWLRVDGSDDDTLIESLMGAAQQYITNASGYSFDPAVTPAPSDLAVLAVRLLVAHWYENREPTGSASQLVFSLQSIFAQLKYCDQGTTTV